MAEAGADIAVVANGMMERAGDAATRYLGKGGQAILDQIEHDHPPMDCMIGRHEGHFRYRDLPDFAFAVMPFSGDPALLVFGKGRFEGFVLQMPPSLDPAVDLQTGAGVEGGHHARALLNHLVMANRAIQRPGMAAAYGTI